MLRPMHMKTLSALLVVIVMTSCNKTDDATPTAPVNNNFDTSSATLLRSGMLMGSGSYSVSGTASIYESDGNRVLVLDPFSSTNGPDLKVYLSTTDNAASFVNLGSLKSTTGKQTYSIPATVDIVQMKFVLIWCQQFSVRFGKAEAL